MACGILSCGAVGYLLFEADLLLVVSVGLLSFSLLDWLWFRFFDRNYPEDDLPPDEVEPVEIGALLTTGLPALLGLMMLLGIFWA